MKLYDFQPLVVLSRGIKAIGKVTSTIHNKKKIYIITIKDLGHISLTKFSEKWVPVSSTIKKHEYLIEQIGKQIDDYETMCHLKRLSKTSD
jgi:hypothetical protein